MSPYPLIAMLTALSCCCASPKVDAEPVIGQFELKTLESSPGAFQFQSQNAWSWGHPARQAASDGTGQPAFDENSAIRQRHALELQAGFTRSLKMRAGIEFEKERFDDPETAEQANAFVVYLTTGAEDAVNLSVGIGLLAGLNSDTADQTLKLSIEVNF